jgi:hypothetical protein
MRVQRLVGVNTFNIKGWFRGGSTLEFVHELFESGIEFVNSSIELLLDVVHFGINNKYVKIPFLISFVFVCGSHSGMRSGSTKSVIYTTMINETRGSQWSKWEIRVSGKGWVHGKKGLKIICIIVIKAKRRIQWERSQIMVRT